MKASLISLLSATLAIAAAPARASDYRSLFLRPVVGAWEVTITPVNCSTGQEFPQASFLSYLSFGAGGTLTETTSNRSFEPGQRGPGHGHWQHTGRNTYHSIFNAFVLFDSDPSAPRYVRGIQTVDQSMEMQGSDRWTSDALVTFQNEAGERVSPSGCAKAVGVRMP